MTRHAHVCACVHICCYTYTHAQRSISWSFWLTTSISLFASFFFFSCKKEENKNINHMNILSLCQQGNYAAYQRWTLRTLMSHAHTHTSTHPHIMEIWKVILYTYVPICTIRTAVCNFIKLMEGEKTPSGGWWKVRKTATHFLTVSSAVCVRGHSKVVH